MCGSCTGLLRTWERRHYDTAVISFVLHEIDERERAAVLTSVMRRSRRVILADYRVPRVPGVMDAATEVVEFFAGREHYNGFRSFVRQGGLEGLLAKAGVPAFRCVEGVPLPANVVVLEGPARSP